MAGWPPGLPAVPCSLCLAVRTSASNSRASAISRRQAGGVVHWPELVGIYSIVFVCSGHSKLKFPSVVSPTNTNSELPCPSSYPPPATYTRAGVAPLHQHTSAILSVTYWTTVFLAVPFLSKSRLDRSKIVPRACERKELRRSVQQEANRALRFRVSRPC